MFEYLIDIHVAIVNFFQVPVKRIIKKKSEECMSEAPVREAPFSIIISLVYNVGRAAQVTYNSLHIARFNKIVNILFILLMAMGLTLCSKN